MTRPGKPTSRLQKYRVAATGQVILLRLCRKIGTIAHAVYERVDSRHVRKGGRMLSAAAWVGQDERLPFPALASWMARQGFDACCAYRADTVIGMLAAVQADTGLLLCTDDDRLARLCGPPPEVAHAPGYCL